MKKILFVFVMALVSCSSFTVNKEEAKATAEKAIQLIGDRNYDELSQLYSNDFAHTESKELRQKKFDQIVDAVGPVVSFSLQDSANVDVNENNELILKYEVTHEKMTTVEEYTMVPENGKAVISRIDIQQKN